MDDPELRIHIHAALCRVADLVLFRYNPCGRDADGCMAGEPCCIGGYPKPGQQGLCQFCGDKGCTLPNIGCKLSLCDEARAKADPMVLETFRILDDLACLWGITNHAKA